MDSIKRKEIFMNNLGGDLPVSFINWLFGETDYFEAPASAKFHGSYEGGLFDHSYAVAEELRHLTDALGLKWERDKSPEIIGYFHDACKINFYQHSSATGPYTYRDDGVFSGHGEKSLLMLLQHLKLTQEEILCIGYHMGAFVDQKEWPYFRKACQQYPNVLYAHLADMMVSQVKGI